MEGRLDYRIGGGLDFQSPLMNDIQNSEYSSHLHRSIDTLRSLNDRASLNITLTSGNDRNNIANEFKLNLNNGSSSNTADHDRDSDSHITGRGLNVDRILNSQRNDSRDHYPPRASDNDYNNSNPDCKNGFRSVERETGNYSNVADRTDDYHHSIGQRLHETDQRENDYQRSLDDQRNPSSENMNVLDQRDSDYHNRTMPPSSLGTSDRIHNLPQRILKEEYALSNSDFNKHRIEALRGLTINGNNSANNLNVHRPSADSESDFKTNTNYSSTPSSPGTPLSVGDGSYPEEKVFGSKADLQLHTQMHMREAKPYKCSQCCKAFANSSYLSQHTRIHLGIKPYRCEICQRKFTQLSHLQQHIRTHTGDKPYKCRHPGCQKAFSQLSNLQSHSRCHQTDKPYKCNSCYKCFSDEPSLLEHIPKHKESKHLKTHICQYCGKSYTQETYLTKHMQKHSERTDKRPPITGLGLNRNLLAAAGTLEPSYWSKLSPDTMSNLDLERIEYQNSVLEQQRNLNSNINNVLEHSQQRNGSNLNSVLDHQRHSNLNSNANSILERGSNENNTVGEDLVVIRQSPGGNNSENGSSNANAGATPTSNYSEVNKNAYEVSISKSVSNSAFTPINSIGHLNNLNLNHHMAARPYIYDALSFQNKQAMDLNLNKSVQNSNGFPNQLISLHQIRNYAHQPTSGLMSEHSILGLKDK